LRLLLDTHIAFWLAADREQLNSKELALVGMPDTECYLPTVALWELRIKWDSLYRSGEPKGPISPMAALITFRALQLPIIPLVPDIAAATLLHPIEHKDPFDVLLLVHAQELDMKLLTRDKKLRGHPLAHFA
jgi:PIN domain nuclease of toxin-antitoxin system